MSYCPKCGSKLSEDDNFCSNCGAAISSSNNFSYGRFKYAGFWRRFLAAFIDIIILSVVWTIIFEIVGNLSSVDPMSFYEYGYSVAYELDPEIVIWQFVVALATWIYYAAFESSSRQATLGKMALGIVVTDYEGERISFAKATGRYFSKIISATILFIGYIMAAFTEQKQALHDIMAGTLVIKKQKYNE